MAVSSPVAVAAPGYELATGKSSFPLAGEFAHGIAIDQTSQLVYVTEITTNAFALAPGQTEQFDANGVPTANSPFHSGTGETFTGVAVNQTTHDVYTYESAVATPFGTIGNSEITKFSSTGAVGSFFSSQNSIAAQIAIDSSGRIFYPNETADTVQIFDSAGALKATVTCAGCPGGAFNNPSSVALDSADNLYVVDFGTGRAIRFEPSGGGAYAYDSILRNGPGAVAVGVDPSSNDVFVGVLENGSGYHIVAYDSSGVQFDDFGAGTFLNPPKGPETAGQIAVNATTRKLYATDAAAKKVWMFDRVATIALPVATTDPATPVGQLGATLKATVNAKGHATSDCHFEYTNDADFQANEYANAIDVPCSSKPGGLTSVQVSAPIAGLAPSTTYDFRVIATSNAGTTTGATRTFTTLPAVAPTVTTGSASAIGSTTATISGSVNPNGGPVSSCKFEYGLTTAYATSVPCPVAPGSGTSAVLESAALTGLQPATSYHYRLVATNNAGTDEGDDQAFATLAESCATNPALCPPPPPQPPNSPAPPTGQPPTSGPLPPNAGGRKPLKCKRGFRKKRVKGKLRCVRVKKPQRR